ncbi:Inositol-tetrakisphosphate 1-kinase [Paragonimus heterotremus]|uniref:Inositol-tetrakisphosphate 1-kinase n=1 Tax=Paragonimus heterotremus TaxID=100268 RepID=A0A8J4TA57_9TREM|nr:Inositol-tetrakisphosphate 1-kinase [Paragonimus heterotremus]
MPILVGILMKRRKFLKMEMDKFVSLKRPDNLEFVTVFCDNFIIFSQIDYDDFTHLELSAILHKIPELLSSDCDSIDAHIESILDYVKTNEKVVVIDAPVYVQRIALRTQQYIPIDLAIRSSEFSDRVSVPPFCTLVTENLEDNLDSLHANFIRFPLICKPLTAHGGSDAHTMALVFNPSGLEKLKFPVVAQQFIDHDDILFKIYVIGEKSFYFVRPSIRNFDESSSQETIFFNSKDVSKDGVDSSLSNIKTDRLEKHALSLIDEPLFSRIAMCIREVIHLDLFGVDVIRYVASDTECAQPKWAIVDVNIFPDYSGVPDFHFHLENLVRQKLSLPLLTSPLSQMPT